MEFNKSKVYNQLIQCKRWRDVRLAYLTSHPLCEKCKKKGIVRAATEVHHLMEVELGRTRVEMEARAYSTANLQALCHECHRSEHNERQSHSRLEHQKREEAREAVWRKRIEDRRTGVSSLSSIVRKKTGHDI